MSAPRSDRASLRYRKPLVRDDLGNPLFGGSSVREFVGRFKHCPQCGSHARVIILVGQPADGHARAEPRVRCGRPCGWPIEDPCRSSAG